MTEPEPNKVGKTELNQDEPGFNINLININ